MPTSSFKILKNQDGVESIAIDSDMGEDNEKRKSAFKSATVCLAAKYAHVDS